MAFKIIRKGLEKPLEPQFREAYLYSYNKIPESLLSNWILTTIGMAGDGENGKHFEYRLSGPLYQVDVLELTTFGDSEGNDVVLTISYRDIPIYDQPYM